MAKLRKKTAKVRLFSGTGGRAFSPFYQFGIELFILGIYTVTFYGFSQTFYISEIVDFFGFFQIIENGVFMIYKRSRKQPGASHIGVIISAVRHLFRQFENVVDSARRQGATHQKQYPAPHREFPLGGNRFLGEFFNLLILFGTVFQRTYRAVAQCPVVYRRKQPAKKFLLLGKALFIVVGYGFCGYQINFVNPIEGEKQYFTVSVFQQIFRNKLYFRRF